MKFINYDSRNWIVEKELILFDKPCYYARPIYGDKCRPAGAENIYKSDKVKEIDIENSKDVILSMIIHHKKTRDWANRYWYIEDAEEYDKKVKDLVAELK